ncbi:MAG: UDP-N-acetylmuramate dehydrogenase [Bacteroidales bacterium]|nr:UDP-N-acetylmuramate dehydrogenase [Bacteroidales bacterium]
MKGLQRNFSLKNYNSFRLDVKSSLFFSFETSEELKILASENHNILKNKKLILGGGSNLLFTKDFEGLVLYPAMNYIEVIDENQNELFVKAGAGLVWDNLVEWSVKNSLYGLENLSLIPGNVGAGPVQNIGAYGTEAKDVIHSVNVLNLNNLEEFSLSNNQCNFGYRNSIFKGELKEDFLVKDVVFKLSKKENYNLDYGNLKDELQKYGETNLINVRQAVINVRQSKLPDPEITGNAGSFFKNPIVSNNLAESLKKAFPEMPVYNSENDKFKLAAGWLIEQCGWKGKSLKNAAVHKNQALVLINTGNANGEDIIELANAIKESVFNKFGVNLEPEVIFV